MLNFAAPWWLLGLLLVPAVRWLHRGGSPRQALPVSRLALWRAAAGSSTPGDRRPPDPAWRRRALLTALFFVALSEPQVPKQQARITVWIDDSLSMLTRETGGTRLAQVMAQARSLLAELPRTDVEVRTLGDPWQAHHALTDATAATIVAAAGRKEPAAPPAALLRRDRLHWLLTDGADPTLFEWPGGRRPDRTIQIADVARNVGLERLSARRNLSDPQRYDLLLKITNGGTEVETRLVVFTTDSGEFARSTHRLEPGASALVSASVPASGAVRAMLQPEDALAEDDRILLDLAPLRSRKVATDPTCPVALRGAVRTHPALELADENSKGVEALVHCGAHAVARDIPTIRVHAHHTPVRLRGSLRWSSSVPESQRIRLDADRLRVAARLDPEPDDAVLLAAGEEPLILGRAGASRILETALDFGLPETERLPEIPLIVDLMFERLLGSRLLDEIAMVDRGPTSTRIAPSDRVGAAADAGAPAAFEISDLTQPFLVVILLVLLWEIVALGRQWRRMRGDRSVART